MQKRAPRARSPQRARGLLKYNYTRTARYWPPELARGPPPPRPADLELLHVERLLVLEVRDVLVRRAAGLELVGPLPRRGHTHQWHAAHIHGTTNRGSSRTCETGTSGRC